MTLVNFESLFTPQALLKNHLNFAKYSWLLVSHFFHRVMELEKITLLGRKEVLQGPIFHFHDFGR